MKNLLKERAQRIFGFSYNVTSNISRKNLLQNEINALTILRKNKCLIKRKVDKRKTVVKRLKKIKTEKDCLFQIKITFIMTP